MSVTHKYDEAVGHVVVTTVLYVIEKHSGWVGGENVDDPWTETWSVHATTTDRDRVRQLLEDAAFGDWDRMTAAVDDSWNRGQGIAPRSTRCRNLRIEIPLSEDSRELAGRA